MMIVFEIYASLPPLQDHWLSRAGGEVIKILV